MHPTATDDFFLYILDIAEICISNYVSVTYLEREKKCASSNITQ